MRILHLTPFVRWNNQLTAVRARVIRNPVAYLLPTHRAPYVRMVCWRTYLRWRDLSDKVR